MPSLTDSGLAAASVTVGATLLTFSVNVVVVVPPLPSFAVIVTGPVWSGPSVVANDQLHVPEFVPVLVTVPRDAEMVTLSPAFASE